MAFTYDTTTDLGTVRLLINDVTTPDHMFEDTEITRFLTLEGNDAYRAAATALTVVAGNEVLRMKWIRSRGLELDGPSVGRELRQEARDLREQSAERDGADAFVIAANNDGYDWPA